MVEEEERRRGSCGQSEGVDQTCAPFKGTYELRNKGSAYTFDEGIVE